jgi:hypothetical protein
MVFTMPQQNANALASLFAPKFNLEMGPYYQSIREGLKRARRLIGQTRSKDTETNDDILRAIVVLTHAYIEDFLRTLARTLLPVASERVLNGIPLAGSAGRAEKFFLGALSKHRGRTIEEVIQDSVSEHLDRSNFNDPTEIVSFLRNSLDITLPTKASEKLPALDRMIQRRHLIVHRADRVKKSGSAEFELQAIDSSEVVDWVLAATDFMAAILESLSPSIDLLSVVKPESGANQAS